MPQTKYPTPGHIGGKLLRALVRGTRAAGVTLPVTSDILIATSGGSDSVALAHALVHYGRRVVPRQKICLLHINHGWRGAESDQDEEFVRSLGDSWGIPMRVHRLKPRSAGRSPEDEARQARKQIYADEAERLGGLVFTAHQEDDLAETVLWRLCTGQAATHGAGILTRDGNEVRPALRIRKSLLRAYLVEEGCSWREDRTNTEGQLLRSRLRQKVMPELEAIFPRFVGHLADSALRATHPKDKPALAGEIQEILQAAGLRLRKPHWAELEKRSLEPGWVGSIDLPGGWRLTRSRSSKEDGFAPRRKNL